MANSTLSSRNPTTVLLSRMDCVVPEDATVADVPLVQWAELLAPSGALNLTVPTAMAPAFSIPLLLAGYVGSKASEDKSSGNTVVTAYKPKWEMGASAKLAVVARPARVVLSTAMDDDVAADDDLIDEDDLLGADAMELQENKKEASDCSKKRRACAGCSCGRAEREALEEAGGVVVAGEEPAESACGNCYKGDAFRCASCPHLGKPAFKPGQETVKLEIKDDFE